MKDDSAETSIDMSILPISTNQRNIPINDW